MSSTATATASTSTSLTSTLPLPSVPPSTATSTYASTTRHTLSRRPGRRGIVTASTPNLNQLYTAHAASSATPSTLIRAASPALSVYSAFPAPSNANANASSLNTTTSSSHAPSHSSRLAPPALSRKGSYAALTPSTLAAIPDDSDTYPIKSVLTSDMPTPISPAAGAGGRYSAVGAGASAADDPVTIGDTVEVPGNMLGTVRFIGPVTGRKGIFCGVELHPEFASRGKNSGDVDGVYYFTTAQPGSGIFLPLSKAIKRDPPPVAPATSYPISPTGGGLKASGIASKFSQSLGPGRSQSPIGKKVRPSGGLQRPESPVRRLTSPAPSRPSITTAPKATPTPSRFGSPTSTSKFSQSVRSSAGDPNKRVTPSHTRKGSMSIGPRSASVLGTVSQPSLTDDEGTPRGSNGGYGGPSSFALKVRPASRSTSQAGTHTTAEDEIERLRAELEDRDRQLREQAQTLAEMEASLNELQGIIENSEGPPVQQRRNSLDDKDVSQLKALIREKNDKIAMLTAEFDAHRADFRSTIDTLEMASAETERVYEKRIEELMEEIRELQERTADVDTVAAQLKQLEELVQELEEGLEDARRGEAEARGEVEFLRGEVERTRAELRREREKASVAGNGSVSKELEQKEDEIRGLKAIIHSLSRDSVPGGEGADRALAQNAAGQSASIDDRLARERLEREVAELRALLESKTAREEELERELEQLRRGQAARHERDRSSIRDSRATVVGPSSSSQEGGTSAQAAGRAGSKANANGGLDTLESDTYSTATDHSTLWCEICETSGHDILSCTNVFGDKGPQRAALDKQDATSFSSNRDTLTLPVRTRGGASSTAGDSDTLGIEDDPSAKPAPLSPMRPAAAKPASSTAGSSSAAGTGLRQLPNPHDNGPVAGKESGVVDASKWCALCERDGHDSVDCPFEDAF